MHLCHEVHRKNCINIYICICIIFFVCFSRLHQNLDAVKTNIIIMNNK